MRIPSRSLRPFLCLAGTVFCLVSVALAQVTPSVSFLGIPSNLNTGSAFTLPTGLAVDALGDIFVADRSTQTISKIVAVNGSIPASPTIQTLSITISGGSTPFVPNAPKNMTIDGGGNLFVACTGGLWEITAASGYATASKIFDLTFQGVAADSSGNLFVTNPGGGTVLELTAPNYAPSLIISGLNTPLAIAVDASDNVFVADQSGASIQEFANSYGTYPAGTVLAAAGSVHGLAIDAGGNLIISDFNSGIFELPAFTNYTSEITLSSGFTSGMGVATAPNGNIVLAHWTAGSLAAGVYQMATNVNFGSVNVGTAKAPSRTLPFQVANGITISSVNLLTLGVANLDFRKGSATTCVSGTTNTNCNVVANFLPLSASMRPGAVVINSTDGTNTYTTTVPLYGIGDGPQIGLNPPAESVIGAPSVYPWQVAVDGAGNVFETYYDDSGLYKIPAGGGTATALTLAPDYPSGEAGIAIDGAGNLYLSDVYGDDIVVANQSGGAWVLPITGARVWSPYGLALDGAGNLYVADNQGYVEKIAIQNPGTSLVSGVATVVPSGSYQFLSVYGVGVDNSGNVYALDTGHVEVVKITPDGVSSVLTFPNSITLNGPYGLGVDGFGNVYIADSGNNRVIEQTPAGVTKIITPAMGVDFPMSVTVDSAGRIYTSDYYGERIVVQDPNSMPSAPAFATTNAGQTSSDSPQTFSFANVGDRNLTFAGLSYPTNFPANSSDGNLCSTSVPLAPGASCDVSINFVPTASGNLSANVQLSDNSLNASPAVQSIAVSGAGVAVGTATTFRVTPSPAVAGQPVTFTASVSPTPLGNTTVKFYNGSTLIGTASVDSSGNATFITSSLTAGSMSVTAVFAGNSGFGTSTSTAQNLVVNPGQPGTTSTSISFTTSPNPAVAGQPETFAATLTPAPTGSSRGTVSFYNGSILLGTAAVSASGVASLTTSNLSAGNMSVTAVYSGTTGFAPSTSTAHSVVVNPKQTGTPTRISVSASPNPVYAGDPFTLTATVTPAPTGGSKGNVDFYSGSTLLGTATVNASGVATLTMSTLSGGAHSMTAVYSGNSAFAASTSAVRSQTVDPAYTVSAAKTQYSVAPGGSAQVSLSVPPVGGDFNSAVTMSVSGVPSGAKAAFDPPAVTPGRSGAATILKVSLPATASALQNRRSAPFAFLALAVSLCGGFLPLGQRRRGKNSVLGAISIAAFLLGTLMITGCGNSPSGGSNGSGGPTVQPGNYTLTITGSSGSLQRSKTVTLEVQ